MTVDEITRLRERWTGSAAQDVPRSVCDVIVALLDEVKARGDAIAAATAAMAEMAYNWRAHSSFSTIDCYAAHDHICSGNDRACSCGLAQSRAVLKTGRGAIDAVLPAGDHRRTAKDRQAERKE